MTRDEWVKGFWRRVLRLGARQCWLWRGTLTDGYGQLKRPDGTNIYAHRASVEIATGRPVPKNRVVMHTCDNPRCVNPAHLRVATQKANVQDMHRKGRAVNNYQRGNDHHSSKISEQQVADMRRQWDSRRTERVTQQQLADQYGITQAQVSRIVNRKRR